MSITVNQGRHLRFYGCVVMCLCAPAQAQKQGYRGEHEKSRNSLRRSNAHFTDTAESDFSILPVTELTQ